MFERSRDISVVLFLSLFVLSSANVRAGSDDDREAIRELDRQWVEAIEEENLGWIADLYSEHGYFMPPGAPAIQGQDHIRKAWNDMIEAPNYVSLVFEPTEIGISESGDLAYDVGTYEFRTKNAAGETASQPGKYLVVWKKVDDDWKVKADMFNPNVLPE